MRVAGDWSSTSSIVRGPIRAQPKAILISATTPLNVLLVGALSQTGQLVARSLAREAGSVTALCDPLMCARISDDTGVSLANANVRPFQGSMSNVDAVIIATDDPPPLADLEYLLQKCGSVPHTVLLSRIGASKGAFGIGKWKDVEAAVTSASTTATIIRCGEPLIGGPFYALNPDLLAKGNAELADQWKGCDIKMGDGTLKQGGFGTSRYTAANAIKSVLRRPASNAAYSVVSLDSSEGKHEVATAAVWDVKFEQASGDQRTGAAGGSTAVVTLDVQDEGLAQFTQPQEVAAPNPLVAPLAASGPYWATILLFIYGTYLTTTPGYIEATGIKYWGS